MCQLRGGAGRRRPVLRCMWSACCAAEGRTADTAGTGTENLSKLRQYSSANVEVLRCLRYAGRRIIRKEKGMEQEYDL